MAYFLASSALFASVVQKPYSDLGVCFVLAVQRASVLVRVNLSEMACYDTEVELKLALGASRDHDACVI